MPISRKFDGYEVIYDNNFWRLTILKLRDSGKPQIIRDFHLFPGEKYRSDHGKIWNELLGTIPNETLEEIADWVDVFLPLDIRLSDKITLTYGWSEKGENPYYISLIYYDGKSSFGSGIYSGNKKGAERILKYVYENLETLRSLSYDEVVSRLMRLS